MDFADDVEFAAPDAFRGGVGWSFLMTPAAPSAGGRRARLRHDSGPVPDRIR